VRWSRRASHHRRVDAHGAAGTRARRQRGVAPAAALSRLVPSTHLRSSAANGFSERTAVAPNGDARARRGGGYACRAGAVTGDASPAPPSLFTFVRPLWVWFTLAGLAQLGAAGVYLLTPRAFGACLDSIAGGSGSFVSALLSLATLYALQSVWTFLQSWLLLNATERLSASLREACFASLLRKPLALFDERAAGELISRTSTDVAAVRVAVESAAKACRAAAEVIGAIAVLALMSPALTVTTLGCAPVAAALGKTFGEKVKALSKIAMDSLAETQAIAEESVASVSTVKSFTREAIMEERFAAASARSRALAEGIAVKQGALEALVRTLGNLVALAILGYGGSLVSQSMLSIGQLTSFIIYSLYISTAFGTLATSFADFKRAEGSGTRVFELLASKAEVEVPETGGDGRETGEEIEEWSIEFDDVSFRYPARPEVLVLDGVSFKAPAGKTTALVGASGSGKSTIAALVQRFYDVESGQIRFGGRDARSLPLKRLRENVGVVSQSPALFTMTVADNIRIGSESATSAEVQAAAEAANVSGFALDLPEKLDTPLGPGGALLSGGQRQRVAIARALLKDAPVLILDEATSALDSTSEREVQKALSGLGPGRTCLVIAHRLQTVREADHVVVLENGVVIEEGSYQDLAGRRGGSFAEMLRNADSSAPREDAALVR